MGSFPPQGGGTSPAQIWTYIARNLTAQAWPFTNPGAAVTATNIRIAVGSDPLNVIRDAILNDATTFAGGFIDVAISSRAVAGAAMTLTAAERLVVQALIIDDVTPFSGADIAAILADVTGIAGAAMRGTELALLAANYKSFSAFYYTAALADSASYTPPADTILDIAFLQAATVAAEEDWILYWGVVGSGSPFLDAFDQFVTLNKLTIKGPVYCDGTNVKVGNFTGAEKTLHIVGRTYS